MNTLINKDRFSKYIENHEVVYQVGGCLVEVSHGQRSKKSIALSSLVKNSPNVRYAEFDKMKYEFPDLVDWAVEEIDALIFVSYDVLICIPKKNLDKIQ